MMIERCIYCKRIIQYDFEGDLVHIHLANKGVDERLCEPSNPNSNIATMRYVK